MTVSAAETVISANPHTGWPVRQLTSSALASVHGYYDLCPWSPDGEMIAFTRLDAGAETGTICMIPSEGGAVVPLAPTRTVTPNCGAMPQWSADGRRIYFSDRENGERRLAWVEVSTGEVGSYPGGLRMLSPTENVQAYHLSAKDFTPEQFCQRRSELGVFIQNLATGASRSVAMLEEIVRLHPDAKRVESTPLFVKHTKWSPDGKRIVFTVTNRRMVPNDLLVKDLYVVNADGTNLRRLGEFANHASWHPDGVRVLANASWPGRAGRCLVLMHADTGQRELIDTHGTGEALKEIPGGHPSFSADGRYLLVDKVYHPADREASIIVLHMGSRKVEELVRVPLTDHSHAGTHLHPVWSRDSREVLYASDAGGNSELCVVGLSE